MSDQILGLAKVTRKINRHTNRSQNAKESFEAAQAAPLSGTEGRGKYGDSIWKGKQKL